MADRKSETTPIGGVDEGDGQKDKDDDDLPTEELPLDLNFFFFLLFYYGCKSRDTSSNVFSILWLR